MVEETHNRKWIRYEIRKAREEGKRLVGIYIHNIKCPNNGKCKRGGNPFDQFAFEGDGRRLSCVVKCYNPKASDAYSDFAENIEDWIEEAIEIREMF